MSFTTPSYAPHPWALLNQFSAKRASDWSVSTTSSSRSSYSEDLDEDTAESMYEKADEMACTVADVPEMLNDANFRRLKESLRSRGCVTNGYLQQNMHRYVQHVRSVKAARVQRSASFHAEQTCSNAAA